MDTIRELRSGLSKGTITSKSIVNDALARAASVDGEGSRVFTRLYHEQARSAAEAADTLRATSVQLSSLAGLPISVKDLFDMQGEVTTAGSSVLRDQAPAAEDAVVVKRLKQAGAVIIGRTNMTEFAFSGVGLNPHYGTPANPYERKRRLIPGGSSSGAAVSVSDGMAAAAIGSDTGGSVRIPAALCGLTAFKPTQARIPLQGAFPLSTTLDSVGVIGRSVACCSTVDAVLSAAEPCDVARANLACRLCVVPRNYFWDSIDRVVATTIERTLSLLSSAGFKIIEKSLPELEQIPGVNAKGGFPAAESFAFHRRLGLDLADYDSLVRERILRGKDMAASDYLDMIAARKSIIHNFDRAHAAVDFFICPTVPIVAPEIAALEQEQDEFRRTNLLLLRNPSVVNFLDRCALSIPCQGEGDPPVGLMVIGRKFQDRELLNIGLSIENIVASV